jgi:hypothetical protein
MSVSPFVIASPAAFTPGLCFKVIVTLPVLAVPVVQVEVKPNGKPAASLFKLDIVTFAPLVT